MTQEDKIVIILINYMALEGAKELFGEESPSNDSFESFKDEMIENENGPPQWWNGKEYIENKKIKDSQGGFEYSWLCLTGIRNNLFHANKAMVPDVPKRLDFLLDWSVRFIKKIYDDGGDMANKAREIREKLEIKSYLP